MQEKQTTTEQNQAVMPANHSDPPDEVPPTTVVVAVDQRIATPQETHTLLRPTPSLGALGQCSKSEAFYTLMEIGLRGGSMVLGHAIVRDIEIDLRETKVELKTLSERYHNECVRTAVLEGQLRSERKLKILQNVLITGGGLLNAMGIKLLFDQQQQLHSPALVFLAVGILLTVAGWLWPKGGEQKK